MRGDDAEFAEPIYLADARRRYAATISGVAEAAMASIMAASSALAAGYNPGYYPIDSCGDRTMPTDIHCICKTGESHEPQAGRWIICVGEVATER